MLRTILCWIGIALLSAAQSLLGAQTPSSDKSKTEDKKADVTIVNSARIYFPCTHTTGEKVQKVKFGTVSSQTIFDAIPEYQEIKRRDLDPSSAEYLLYMKRASDRFKDAISRTVSRCNYDLLAEPGAVTSSGQPLPDATQEVLKNL